MGEFVKKKVVAFLDLSSAYHTMDENQWWINSQEFNCNSQLLNSYKTCIFTPQSGLTKTASHPKREVSVAQTGPPQPDCELHNITGILPAVDIADLYICYDSFLARASKLSWEGAPF